MDVEKSDIDGAWYVTGFAPRKSEKDKQKEKIEVSISELQIYLANTDWYAVRYAETGVMIPEDIRERRQSSREEIDALRLELSALKDGAL